MRTRLVPLLTAMIAAAVLAGGALAAEGARDGKGRRGGASQLTPEQRAVVEQARDLQKEIRIARLELALAEAKDAPEGEIARRAENVYRLQGKSYVLRKKNPQVFRIQGQQRARRRAAMGFGPGQQMGPQMGRGMREGMGRGMRQGMGPATGPQMGRGMREGMGRGMRQGMGPGMGPQMGRGMRGGTGPAGPMMRGMHAPAMGPPPPPEEMLPPPEPPLPPAEEAAE